MLQGLSAETSSREEPVSETVVSAVVEATGIDPLSMEPLSAVVDTDALNTLFEGNEIGPDQSPNRVEFTYCDCDVIVTGDGEVRVSTSGEDPVKVKEWK